MTEEQIHSVAMLMLGFSGHQRPTLAAAESAVRQVVAESRAFRDEWRGPETATVDAIPFLGVDEFGRQYVITELHCEYTGGPSMWTWKCETTYGIRLAAWKPLPPPPTTTCEGER